MTEPVADPVATGTVLGWAGVALSSLIGGIVGLFSRTMKDHELRLREHSSKISDAQATADHAKQLFATAVETQNLYTQRVVSDLTAVINLNAAKTQAAIDLHGSETNRKIEALHGRFDLAGIRRTRVPTPDDGA